jgi:hypothetical protein
MLQCTGVELFCLSSLCMVGNLLPTGFKVLGFRFLSPVRRLDQMQTSGEVGRALFEYVAA